MAEEEDMSDAVDIAAGVLSQVTKLLKKLSPVQLSQLFDGSASIAFVPPGHRVAAPRVTAPKGTAPGELNVDDLASSLRMMTSSAEVVERLLPDKKVTVAVVNQLAKTFRITIPSRETKREQKISTFAESLVGYQENAEAVMGGTYRA
jgi:hypothetical protein